MTRPTALPDGAAAVTPHLICDGADAALDFYAAAFDAEAVTRLPGPDGRLVHAMMLINGAPIMVADENQEWNSLGPITLGGTPVTIHLSVADVDAAVAQAVDAGATVVMEPADQFWGDRYGIVHDPWGHEWSLATPGQNPPQTDEEMMAAIAAAFPEEGGCPGS